MANIPSSLTLASNSQTQITALWSANSNPAGTQYYIANTTAGTNSGWTTNLSWASANLTCSVNYSFRAKSKNGDGTETAFTDSATIATQNCGGGLSPSAYNPPALPPASSSNPEGKFSVTINNGDEYTTSEIVKLKLYTGKDATKMAISNTPDFKNASLIPYQEEIKWELEITNSKSQITNKTQNTNYNSYELWPAKDYDQQNPQTTDATGKYSFFVPEGSYYLKAEASGYLTYQSEMFVVSEAENVRMNLEIKTVDVWKSISQKTLVFAVIALSIIVFIFAFLLAYNFYQDKARRKFN